MERLKRIAFRLVFLPGCLVWLISLPSFALVICVLATGLEDFVWAYISYGASAYALIICCFNAPRMIHTARSGFSDHLFVQKTVDSQQGQRFMSDSMYRAEIALYAGLAINLEDGFVHCVPLALVRVAGGLLCEQPAGVYLRRADDSAADEYQPVCDESLGLYPGQRLDRAAAGMWDSCFSSTI